MVQKSGYFSRSAAGQRGRPHADPPDGRGRGRGGAARASPGVVGQDEERDDELRTIEFDRIVGGKAFDTSVDWFQSVLKRTGQV